LSKRDLKRELIEKSIELIEKKGMENVSLREVAKECGVSHNAPYSHFKNKKSLLEAVAKEGFQNFRAGIDQIIKSEAENKILEIGVFYIKSAIEKREMWRVMCEMSVEPEDDELAQISEEGFALFVALVGGDMDLALQLWATTHGFATLYNGGNIDRFFDKSRTLDENIRAILQTKVKMAEMENSE
jgi:AcrR family transcriptional regulator